MKTPAFSADIWRHISDSIAPYPVRQLWLTADHDRLIGLLLLPNGRTSDELLETLAGYGAGIFRGPGEGHAALKVSALVHPIRSPGEGIGRPNNLSRTDPLTGLANSRYLQESLALELDRVTRTRLPCSLLMLEIDRFKFVNDTYGHENGNAALQYVAKTLNQGLSKIDVAARCGGGKFALILPATDMVRAVEAAERLRLAIREQHLILQGEPVAITASFGVAIAGVDGAATAEGLIKLADEELSRAQKEGMDRVCHLSVRRPIKCCQVTVEERAQLLTRLAVG